MKGIIAFLGQHAAACGRAAVHALGSAALAHIRVKAAGLVSVAFNDHTSSTSLAPRSVPKDSNQPATLLL